jgi:hypothetical protein
MRFALRITLRFSSSAEGASSRIESVSLLEGEGLEWKNMTAAARTSA